jgi:fumarylacetoacetase
MSGPQIDDSHDPALRSWVTGADNHPDFPVQNLPYGIFAPAGGGPRGGAAIGNHILDLPAIGTMLTEPQRAAVSAPILNAVFALPADQRTSLRQTLSRLLSDEAHRAAIEPHLYSADNCTSFLPAAIGDYTDFYVGIHHARNVGAVFRPDNPLLPNYKYVPIGYHGRASSIRPSGVPLVRPKGQRKAPDAEAPTFGPTARLDYELELGVWIGQGNALGTPIDIAGARDHVAGFCLLNDWSARDFQAWEYQPLGPFLAKNFQSTISPWVVTAEAMAPFRIAQPARPSDDPRPLDYLWDEADQRSGALAITLEVAILTQKMRDAGMSPHRLSRGPASNMYWTVAQIVTHHASNGCNLQPGDLLGTGTISAADSGGFGSLMEITRNGQNPLTLPSGEARSFVEDGDEIILSATAHRDGFVSIGFGPCRAMILQAVA